MIGLKRLIKSTSKSLSPSTDSQTVIKSALMTARRHVKRSGGKKYVKVSRILPVSKQGGFLPARVPLFAGLSALGSLAGGAAGIAQAINRASAAKRQVEKQQT